MNNDMTSSVQIQHIDIAYFSWTGNGKKVVHVIAEELLQHIPDRRTRLLKITPKRNYPYLVWLLFSFIPGLGVKIECEPPSAPTVILVIPKWTVNCPPVTTFLRKGYLRNRNVFLVITYGGFDQDRYAENYRKKVARASAGVQDVLLVKRRRIQEGNFADVRSWTKKITLSD